MPSSCIGKRTLGKQVVLIGTVHELMAEHFGKSLLPLLDDVDHSRRLDNGVLAHRRLRIVRADAKRHHGDGGQLGELVEHPEQGVVEHFSVVDPGTHHDLAVDLDVVIEQRPQPSQAVGPAPIAKHARSHIGISRMNGNIEGRQSLGDHSLEVGLGEAGERREVAVQERKSVVVVLQVQASTQTFRKLVDETELAVVIARLNAIEYCCIDLSAKRFACLLLDLNQHFDATADDLEFDVRFVDE